jgi:hypothetical protein
VLFMVIIIIVLSSTLSSGINRLTVRTVNVTGRKETRRKSVLAQRAELCADVICLLE